MSVYLIATIALFMFALWSNNDWYKKCREVNDDWYEECVKICRSSDKIIKELDHKIFELEERIKRLEDES